MAAGNNDQDVRLSVLDKAISLLTSIKTFKQLAIKLTFIVFMFFMVLVWYKWDDVFDLLKSGHMQSQAVQEIESEKKFESASIEQLKIAHRVTGADFSAIFSFRPKNTNYFVDMVAYEGRLPPSLDPKNLGGVGVDRTNEEYIKHVSGLPYISNVASDYLPKQRDDVINVAYTFSCPYFNLDNYYSGSVLMEWYKKKPEITETRLIIVCSQASRILGRIR